MIRSVKYGFILLLISCVNGCNKTNSTHKVSEILIAINEVLVVNEDIDIIVITESDCSSCFSAIRSMKNQTEDLVGLYFSKDNKSFLKTLKKLNPNIKWIPLKNRTIPKKIEEYKNSIGPFRVTRKNNYVIIEKIN